MRAASSPSGQTYRRAPRRCTCPRSTDEPPAVPRPNPMRVGISSALSASPHRRVGISSALSASPHRIRGCPITPITSTSPLCPSPMPGSRDLLKVPSGNRQSCAEGPWVPTARSLPSGLDATDLRRPALVARVLRRTRSGTRLSFTALKLATASRSPVGLNANASTPSERRVSVFCSPRRTGPHASAYGVNRTISCPLRSASQRLPSGPVTRDVKLCEEPVSTTGNSLMAPARVMRPTVEG